MKKQQHVDDHLYLPPSCPVNVWHPTQWSFPSDSIIIIPSCYITIFRTQSITVLTSCTLHQNNQNTYACINICLIYAYFKSYQKKEYLMAI